MAMNQRKMFRSMSPGGGTPFHDAYNVQGKIHSSVSSRRAVRAVKKQVKTRENREWQKEASRVMREDF